MLTVAWCVLTVAGHEWTYHMNEGRDVSPVGARSCLVRPGRPGERRLEMEFAPPEKARMQKAISVHQTCSLYPYTEMARARETNSTTSLPRGGPQHP